MVSEHREGGPKSILKLMSWTGFLQRELDIVADDEEMPSRRWSAVAAHRCPWRRDSPGNGIGLEVINADGEWIGKRPAGPKEDPKDPGPIGERGPQGPAGIEGPQGPRGVQRAQMVRGPSRSSRPLSAHAAKPFGPVGAGWGA